MQRPQLKQEKGSQRGGALEVAGSAKTTTEAGKRLPMGGGGHWKLQGVQRQQLKQEKGSQWGGGSATRIRLNGGGQ